MLSVDFKGAVASFVRSLKLTAEVKQFLSAREGYETDAELKQLREALSKSVAGFRARQAAGTLSELEINQVRTLQSKLDQHPRTKGYLGAQREVMDLLKECNQQILEVLGIDFSAFAAPPGCC